MLTDREIVRRWEGGWWELIVEEFIYGVGSMNDRGCDQASCPLYLRAHNQVDCKRGIVVQTGTADVNHKVCKAVITILDNNRWEPSG